MSENTNEQGITLALNAMAEVLTKNNETLDNINTFFGYIAKAAEEDEKEEQEKEDEKTVEDEKEELVKAITDNVFNALLKAMSDSGAKGEDNQKASIKTNKEDMQGTIENGKVGSKPGLTPPNIGPNTSKADDSCEGKEDESEEKDEKKEEYSQIEELKKQMNEMQKAFDTKLETEVSNRLRKAGWKEEKGLNSPIRTEIGAGEVDIKKGDSPEEVEKKLAKLPYNVLKRMELNSDADNIPDNIRQLIQ